MADGIKLSRLSVGHAVHTPTVRGADLVLNRGSLGVVLGRNGVGKSTLLETIAAIRAPLSGSVELGGVDPHQLPPAARASLIGYLPQNEGMPSSLTALELVLMGRRALQGLWPFDRSVDVAEARRALERCCADSLADRRLGRMSGGEFQRVRLAQALVSGSSFLLLDEPSSHLDPRHRIEIWLLLRGLVADGITALVVTHDLDLAMRADSAWLLNVDGAATGGPPASVLTAEALEAAFGIPFDYAVLPSGIKVPIPKSTWESSCIKAPGNV